MYSYYALALLKINCTWKRYLTQAQLLQFTCVVTYTFCSVFSWTEEQREGKHILGAVIQIWEMVSLFMLFSIFYKKSYGKGKAKKEKVEDDDDDQCKAAVEAAVSGAAQVVETAAKETTKAASSAAKAITETGVQTMQSCVRAGV